MARKNDENLQFAKVGKVTLSDIYSDDPSLKRRYDMSVSNQKGTYSTPVELREAISQAVTSGNTSTLVETSKHLYATNPIYAGIIDYLTNMFMWRYKVVPHRNYINSKTKIRKQAKEADFNLLYNLMLEVVDGLSLETKLPSLLRTLFIEGSVFFTTVSDEDSITIDTIVLPTKYCRKIGETQFGTAIISFDFSYFNDLGFNDAQLNETFKSFPKEFKSKYNKYRSNNQLRWQELDSRFSSGLMQNQFGIPTYLYVYGSILDFEKYQDNELERNENLLRYIVVHKMPIYQDKIIFDNAEVKELHRSLRNIVETGERSRLITTYGDVSVEKIAENENAENEVLSKAFQAIFNNAGFNSGMFTSESVEGLQTSLLRDRSIVWHYVKSLINFYTIAINNYFDFKDYQADIDILPISLYTYNDDVKVYKDNATLGVNKLDYIIASGVKQKNIADQLYLEQFLKLNDITPMQTSYTQTAQDRIEEDDQTTSTITDTPSSKTEPSEEGESKGGDGDNNNTNSSTDAANE